MPNSSIPLEQLTIGQMEVMNLDELREIARAANITGYTRLKKYDLVMRLLRANAEQQGFIFGGGILEIVQDNIGFLRSDHLLPGPEDVYVSQSQIRRFGLRTGDLVVGQVRPPKDTEKYHGLLKVEAGKDAFLGVTHLSDRAEQDELARLQHAAKRFVGAYIATCHDESTGANLARTPTARIQDRRDRTIRAWECRHLNLKRFGGRCPA